MRKAELKKNKIKIYFTEKNRDKFFRIINKFKSFGGNYNQSKKYWSVPCNEKSIKFLSDLKFSLANEIIKYWEKIKTIKKQVFPIINYNSDLLREYQNKHINKLIPVLQKNNTGLDGSDTGTGKTYSAIAIAKFLKLKIIALVPIASITTWKELAEKFGVDIFASNYEQFQRGNIKYLQKTESYKNTVKNGIIKKKKYVKYKWNTNEKHIIIFDEIHRCGNYRTLNGKMLRACINIPSKVLGLSATITDNALQMYNIGLVLKIFSNWMGFISWGYSRGIKQGHWGMEFNATKENLIKIHDDIFPGKGHRMRVENIPNFPANNIISEIYDMKEAKQIQEKYDELSNILEITKRIQARQEIELHKINTIIELVKDLIKQGYSVPIFVNFTETIVQIQKKLKTSCIVKGSMKKIDKDKNIKDFQSNKEKIIILNNRAGGESISLHDMTGEHPRISIINIPESAKNLKQVLGRIRREGTVAEKVTQILIFCRDTVEEKVAENIRKKINNIDIINDGDIKLEK